MKYPVRGTQSEFYLKKYPVSDVINSLLRLKLKRDRWKVFIIREKEKQNMTNGKRVPVLCDLWRAREDERR